MDLLKHTRAVGQNAIRKAVKTNRTLIVGSYGDINGNIDILSAIALHRGNKLSTPENNPSYLWHEVDDICEAELGCSWAAVRALRDGWDDVPTAYSADWHNLGKQLWVYANNESKGAL